MVMVWKGSHCQFLELLFKLRKVSVEGYPKIYSYESLQYLQNHNVSIVINIDSLVGGSFPSRERVTGSIPGLRRHMRDDLGSCNKNSIVHIMYVIQCGTTLIISITQDLVLFICSFSLILNLNYLTSMETFTKSNKKETKMNP